MLQVLFVFTIACYLAASVLYVKQFFHAQNASAKYALGLTTLGLLSHLIILSIAVQNSSSEQLSLSFVANMLAWLVTLTMFIANKFIKNLLFLPLVCTASVFVIAIDFSLPNTTGLHIDMSVGLISHILLSLVAYGILGICLLYASQLAYINYQLKMKRRSMIQGHLPPLMSVENIMVKLMVLGSALLIISLASGFVFVPNMFADGYAHKTVLSSLAALTYLICIALHYTKGLRARILVVYNIVGISLLSLGYFGSRLVKEFLMS
jgi:ABC-type uncharacterized transport system permease subunit